MDPKQLKYYVVLVGFLPKKTTSTDPSELGRINASKTKSIQNRTFIFGSWAPLIILKRMNDSKDTRILDASMKACDTPIPPSENVNDPSLLVIKPTDIYGIMCVMGPVTGEDTADDLIQKWDKLSRGPQPRTIIGYNLALRSGLEFTINFPLFFQLHPNDVRVDILSHSMEHGTRLRIVVLSNNMTYTTTVTWDGKKSASKPLSVIKRRKRTTRETTTQNVLQNLPAKRKSR